MFRILHSNHIPRRCKNVPFLVCTCLAISTQDLIVEWFAGENVA